MHELPKTGTGKIARQALLNGQSRLPRIGKRTHDRFWPILLQKSKNEG
jgi:hypothetical protein